MIMFADQCIFGALWVRVTGSVKTFIPETSKRQAKSDAVDRAFFNSY